MNKHDLLIFSYLKEHSYEWINAKNLGLRFSCTTRTIRNAIVRMNEEKPNIVLSSRKGYKYNEQDLLDKKIDKTNTKITSNRRSRILMKLIHGGNAGIDLFEWARKLFISDSTLRRDLAKIQELVKKYGLVLKSKDFVYFLQGSERAKRQLIMAMLHGELGFKDSVQVWTKELLGRISFNELRKIIVIVIETNRWT